MQVRRAPAAASLEVALHDLSEGIPIFAEFQLKIPIRFWKTGKLKPDVTSMLKKIQMILWEKVRKRERERERESENNYITAGARSNSHSNKRKQNRSKQTYNIFTLWSFRQMSGRCSSRLCSRANMVFGLRMKIFVFPYLTSFSNPCSRISTRVASLSSPFRNFGQVVVEINLYLQIFNNNDGIGTVRKGFIHLTVFPVWTYIFFGLAINQY